MKTKSVNVQTLPFSLFESIYLYCKLSPEKKTGQKLKEIELDFSVFFSSPTMLMEACFFKGG
jgi:hypothetical protein